MAREPITGRNPSGHRTEQTLNRADRVSRQNHMPKLFIRLLGPAQAGDDGFRVSSAWMIQEDDGRIRAHGETDFRGLSELIDPGTDWLQQPCYFAILCKI